VLLPKALRHLTAGRVPVKLTEEEQPRSAATASRASICRYSGTMAYTGAVCPLRLPDPRTPVAASGRRSGTTPTVADQFGGCLAQVGPQGAQFRVAERCLAVGIVSRVQRRGGGVAPAHTDRSARSADGPWLCWRHSHVPTASGHQPGDLYALGATLHRALTGYNPDGEGTVPPPELRTLRPDLSQATSALIGGLLEVVRNDARVPRRAVAAVWAGRSGSTAPVCPPLFLMYRQMLALLAVAALLGLLLFSQFYGTRPASGGAAPRQ